MPGELAREIRQHIVDTYLFGVGDAALTDDASLLEQGIIDSTGVLDLVGFIEGTFGIQVEDEELVPENFDSLEKIQSFVLRKRA